MRLVLQRSFRRRRQLFSVAMACSPRHRILACVLLCRRCHRLRRRPRKGTRTRAAGALIRLVGPALEAGLGECFDDAVPAGGGQVVSGAGQRGRGPQQPPEGGGEDLDVHAVTFMFPGVVRRVGGDPVDRQEGAVQDHERPCPRDVHGLSQGGRESRQDLDSFAYVAIHGRDADTEPGGQPGVRVAASQMGQGQESLTTGGQTPPSGPDLPSTHSEVSGQTPQGATGQIDRRRVAKHVKLLVAAGDLGREPVYQELRRSPDPSNTRPAPSGWKR